MLIVSAGPFLQFQIKWAMFVSTSVNTLQTGPDHNENVNNYSLKKGLKL